MSKPEIKKLTEQIAQSWTESLRLKTENIALENFDYHQLAAELIALQNGETASLPFFRPDSILWITTAPDAENLEMAIEDLRAWILPSLGWEDEKTQSFYLRMLLLKSKTQSLLFHRQDIFVGGRRKVNLSK
jgi:hypothetical protein